MKTHFTDETLQSAIDEALTSNSQSSLCALPFTYAEKWRQQSSARLDLARALLSQLPEPTPPVVDGKTPGQVAFEAGNEVQKRKFPDQESSSWSDEEDVHEQLEAAASAVLAAFGQSDLDAAIAHMKAIPWKDLEAIYDRCDTYKESINAVRARLIAAAREGQPDAVGWNADVGHRPEEEISHAELWAECNELKGQLKAAKDKIQEIRPSEPEMSITNGDLRAMRDAVLAKQAAEDRAEKAEAELARVRQVYDDLVIDLRDSQNLPQIRPLSEAGDVLEGCVRFLGYIDKDGDWILGNFESEDDHPDTHFADIRLHAQPKPEPTTFQAHGKTWTNKLVEILTFDDRADLFPRTARINMWESTKGWRYADEPADPYAELKAAHAAEKVIQVRSADDGLPVTWYDCEEPPFSAPPEYYRIKPWTLPPPPEGQQWHRTDWTEEMLPEGWRPLLAGEIMEAGDMADWGLNNFDFINGLKGQSVDSVTTIRLRTRRPLPTPPVIVPLDLSDIRATDEFRHEDGTVIQTAEYWDNEAVELTYSGPTDYERLACFLRRQHGSNEWKPCTKEVKNGLPH